MRLEVVLAAGMIPLLGCLALAGVAVGAVQQVVGTVLAVRFARLSRPGEEPARLWPPVTVMKPLCGVDPLALPALESFFMLDYPEYQLVFGVHSPGDPVLSLLERLVAQYPARDVTVVVDGALHGSNRKISNLINMLPKVKHDLLVMSDADVHVPGFFLRRVVTALELPKVGLVTTVYSGLPGTKALAAALGAAQITYAFMPGALMARLLGRQDCLGVTMSMRRETLAEVGGFASVVNHLADDQVLGRLMMRQGYKVSLARVIPATTAADPDLNTLYRHELRWARTIRALVPLPYLVSVFQIPLFWGLAVLLFWGGVPWTLALLAGLFLLRVGGAELVRHALRLKRERGIWLFLLRDLLSVAVFIASYFGNTVHWRGQAMFADTGRDSAERTAAERVKPVPREISPAHVPQDAGP